MKVSNINEYAAMGRKKSMSREKTRSGAGATKKNGSGDVVDISSQGRGDPKEAEEARRLAEERSEKVRRIKELVQSGAYRPDTREVALHLLLGDVEPLL